MEGSQEEMEDGNRRGQVDLSFERIPEFGGHDRKGLLLVPPG